MLSDISLLVLNNSKLRSILETIKKHVSNKNTIIVETCDIYSMNVCYHTKYSNMHF